MIKLSIIIPVFNVELYIERCLRSCLEQDISSEDYEIIVVNDGTKDNSISIVKRLQKKYENIKLIEQTNKGLSAARNTGLRNALGEYIWFVDSDDFIKRNCLSDLLSVTYNNSLDILCFNLQLYFEDGKIIPYNIKYKTLSLCSGEEFICNIKMPKAAWVALYRKDFLIKNNLLFYEGIIHEDQEFTPRAYFLANRILYYDKVIYNYFQRPGSIMNSKSEKRANDLLIVCDALYNFINENLINRNKAYYIMINKISFAFSQSLKYNYTNTKINIYINKPYYPLNINRYLSLKEIFKYLILNLSIKLYSRILK